MDSGTYYVEVRGADDEATGPYTLWVEFVPDPPEVAFTPERLIATDLHEPASVHAADLDGDGDPDVLAASSHDGTITWYENIGGGAFAPQHVLATDAEGAASVHATDLDGDGDAGVLSVAREDDRTAWHENLGGGVFSGQYAIATGAWDVGSLHMADLDGDGDPDVPFVSRHDDEVAWYENLSEHGDDHADAPPGATLVTAMPAFPHGTVESAGDRDVFRVATGAGTLRVRSNGPTDTYGILLDADGERLAADHDAGLGLNFAIEIEAGPHFVAVTDDGNRGGIGPYTLSIEFVAAGVAPGTADDHGDDAETATAVEALPWSAAAALEAPGDRDLFRIDLGTGGRLTVFTSGDTDTVGALMDADGTVLAEDDDTGAGTNFEIEAAVRAGVYYVEVRGFAVETGRYTLTIEFVANPPGVAFGLQNVLTTLANGARAVHAADLDGDGDPDVLSASPHDDKIAWHENQGAGRFSTQRIISTDADGAVWVHAADLDGDGDADVLSASDFDSKIAWYENLGGGNFSSQHPITLEAAGALAVHAADVDGDGDADVLSASHRDDKIAWYENLGDGRFSGQRDIATGVNGAASVHAADMDGDGDLDVLAASFEGNEVAWYENGGAGSFAARGVISQAATSPWTVHPADLDGDRDPDVLAASGHGNGVALFGNTGGGSPATERMIATDARFARSVYAADLDGDGDADVLSASEYDSKIAWYENTADHGDDHGDAPGEATLVSALPAFLHGVLESAGDRDVFPVATGGGTLRVHSEGPTDTYGTVLDAAGTVLDQNDDGGRRVNFELEVEVARALRRGAGIRE